MNLDSEIEKHKRFDTEVRNYIRDCLDNKVNPKQILDVFQTYIDVVIKDKLKESS